MQYSIVLISNCYKISHSVTRNKIFVIVDFIDEAENHSEDGQHETPLETNSNNLQSPLSANINEFREDNESSFFSYFMFLR